MKSVDYAEKAAGFLQTFVEKSGYTLLCTEYVKEDGQNYLRAYIDLSEAERSKRTAELEKKRAEIEAQEENDAEIPEIPEPEVTINDCANVSRRLSKWLDQEDFISDEYTLEVCSRGYLKKEGEES